MKKEKLKIREAYMDEKKLLNFLCKYPSSNMFVVLCNIK